MKLAAYGIASVCLSYVQSECLYAKVCLVCYLGDILYAVCFEIGENAFFLLYRARAIKVVGSVFMLLQTLIIHKIL